MSSNALVMPDPIVFDGSDMADVHGLLGLMRRYHLGAHRCLPPLDLDTLWLNPPKGSSRARVIFVREMFGRDSTTSGPPAKIEACPPRLDALWMGALDQALATGNWRDPYIVTTQSGLKDWNASDEVEIATSTGHPYKRVLVDLAGFEAHPYARRDLDPWRLLTIVDVEPPYSGSADQKRARLRRLPRPPVLRDSPMDRWQQHLEAADSWSCGDEARRYYRPSENWDPRQVDKNDWREGRPFEMATKRLNRGPIVSGFRDRDGRVWSFDESHCDHWDVQCADVRSDAYDNVYPEGEVR